MIRATGAKLQMDIAEIKTEREMANHLLLEASDPVL